MDFKQEYGDLSVLDTRTFLEGLAPDQEIQVQIEHGKTLVVRLLSVSAPDAHANVDVTFDSTARRASCACATSARRARGRAARQLGEEGGRGGRGRGRRADARRRRRGARQGRRRRRRGRRARRALGDEDRRSSRAVRGRRARGRGRGGRQRPGDLIVTIDEVGNEQAAWAARGVSISGRRERRGAYGRRRRPGGEAAREPAGGGGGVRAVDANFRRESVSTSCGRVGALIRRTWRAAKRAARVALRSRVLRGRLGAGRAQRVNTSDGERGLARVGRVRGRTKSASATAAAAVAAAAPPPARRGPPRTSTRSRPRPRLERLGLAETSRASPLPRPRRARRQPITPATITAESKCSRRKSMRRSGSPGGGPSSSETVGVIVILVVAVEVGSRGAAFGVLVGLAQRGRRRARVDHAAVAAPPRAALARALPGVGAGRASSLMALLAPACVCCLSPFTTVYIMARNATREIVRVFRERQVRKCTYGPMEMSAGGDACASANVRNPVSDEPDEPDDDSYTDALYVKPEILQKLGVGCHRRADRGGVCAAVAAEQAAPPRQRNGAQDRRARRSEGISTILQLLCADKDKDGEVSTEGGGARRLSSDASTPHEHGRHRRRRCRSCSR